ncbi:Nmad3 family putative nucleotide modification protein [Alteriqipengyuania sp. 357]
MKIVFSRKGFDSGSGGGSSPIIDGRPVSLPIPDTKWIARTTYGDLGLGELAHAASRGAYGADSLCHHDPMFTSEARCIFGQVGAAQTHLANHGVGRGDVFVFFGRFEGDGHGPHHRIFGYLEVERVIDLTCCDDAVRAEYAALGHPHALGMHGTNDTLYVGPGRMAARASDALRLTAPDEALSRWERPKWLRRGDLSYHDAEWRWAEAGRLIAVSRGQEFVADVGRRKAPREWLARVIAEI